MTYGKSPDYSVDKPVKTELDAGKNIRQTSAHLMRRRSLVKDMENARMLDFTQIGQIDLSIRIVIDRD